jgi:5-methylcytosine-specific restriction endonuclease McrA
MKVVDWRKGLILWFQDKVEILEYHNVYVHSQFMQFRLPAVLKLKKFVKKSVYHRIRFCRENIYLRDDHTCQYCGQHFDKRDLTLDHVLPASKGGPKTWSNVVTSCRPCNQRKGNRTPQQARMPLLKPPVEPLWLPPKELLLTQPGPEVWAEYMVFLGNRTA